MTEETHSLSNRLQRRLTQTHVTRAVVLAGGRGTRLAPYTSVLPKPLMPIGDQAILEIVLRQLHRYGILHVTLSVGYLSHLIQAVIGDGSAHGLSVEHVREEHALGTAAPLRLIDGLDSTFLVMNGDILTKLDYRELVRYHREQKNLVTIAAKKRLIKIDYGVLHVGSNGDRGRLRRFVEKPESTSRVSMGIYIMEPRALDYIPVDGFFDFPDLVRTLLKAGEAVGVYDYQGLWFDIGRADDYEQAVGEWMAGSETEDETQVMVAAASAIAG